MVIKIHQLEMWNLHWHEGYWMIITVLPVPPPPVHTWVHECVCLGEWMIITVLPVPPHLFTHGHMNYCQYPTPTRSHCLEITQGGQTQLENIQGGCLEILQGADGDSPGWLNRVGQMGLEILQGGHSEIPQGGQIGLENIQGGCLEILQVGQMGLEILQGHTWRFPRVVKYSWRISRGQMEIPQGGQITSGNWQLVRTGQDWLEILQGDTHRSSKGGTLGDSPGWSNSIGEYPGWSNGVGEYPMGSWRFSSRTMGDFSGCPNGGGDSPRGCLKIPREVKQGQGFPGVVKLG
ncbi:hypothetical protein EDD15DRAFT_2198551 [Pisolithus albus]|nr:hypothetical protein EDD15DRAFT_2198551 [Pisolithus albus]